MKSERASSLITEGLILAAIPAIGYWAAYIFELGFCNYFDIPSSLIEITPQIIVKSTISIVALSVVGSIFVDAVRESTSHIPRALRVRVRRILMILAIYIGFAAIYGATLTQLIVGGIFLIGPFAFIDFVLPLVQQRDMDSYSSKVEAQRNLEFKFDSSGDLAVQITRATRVFGFVHGYHHFHR